MWSTRRRFYSKDKRGCGQFRNPFLFSPLQKADFEIFQILFLWKAHSNSFVIPPPVIHSRHRTSGRGPSQQPTHVGLSTPTLLPRPPYPIFSSRPGRGSVLCDQDGVEDDIRGLFEFLMKGSNWSAKLTLSWVGFKKMGKVETHSAGFGDGCRNPGRKTPPRSVIDSTKHGPIRSACQWPALSGPANP